MGLLASYCKFLKIKLPNTNIARMKGAIRTNRNCLGDKFALMYLIVFFFSVIHYKENQI